MQVNAGIIETLVRDGYIPVLATVASSPSGESLNVNADIAAGEVRILNQSDRPVSSHGHMLGEISASASWESNLLKRRPCVPCSWRRRCGPRSSS